MQFLAPGFVRTSLNCWRYLGSEPVNTKSLSLFLTFIFNIVYFSIYKLFGKHKTMSSTSLLTCFQLLSLTQKALSRCHICKTSYANIHLYVPLCAPSPTNASGIHTSDMASREMAGRTHLRYFCVICETSSKDRKYQRSQDALLTENIEGPHTISLKSQGSRKFNYLSRFHQLRIFLPKDTDQAATEWFPIFVGTNFLPNL